MKKQILEHLRKHPEGQTSQEISWATKLSKYAISRCAAKMAKAGLLNDEERSAKSATVWRIADAKPEAKS